MSDEIDTRINIENLVYFPLLPPDFDILSADPDRLLEFGVPPQPDRQEQPELFRAWFTMFSAPLLNARPVLKAAGDAFATQSRLVSVPVAPTSYEAPAPSASIAGASTSYETSPNWSGAYIVPHDGKMFVEVTAQWTVPRPSLPLPRDQAPAGQAVDYMCSMWLGLDGQRLYRNSSMPQVGTRQVLHVGADGSQSIETAAWVQWWTRDFPNSPPADIASVPVEPDDDVICTLRVVNPQQVNVYVRNLSTNVYTSFGVPIPDPSLTIAGATAEWIMERPTIFGSTELQRFSGYNSTEFVGCVTAMAPQPGQPVTSEALRGARFIRMFEVLANPSRTVFISMAEKRSDTAIRLTHGDFDD